MTKRYDWREKNQIQELRMNEGIWLICRIELNWTGLGHARPGGEMS